MEAILTRTSINYEDIIENHVLQLQLSDRESDIMTETLIKQFPKDSIELHHNWRYFSIVGLIGQETDPWNSWLNVNAFERDAKELNIQPDFSDELFEYTFMRTNFKDEYYPFLDDNGSIRTIDLTYRDHLYVIAKRK